MRLIALIEDESKSIVSFSTDDLQLRQVEDGLTALIVPAGRSEKDEELIRVLATFPVNLTAPAPKERIDAGVATPLPVDQRKTQPKGPNLLPKGKKASNK
jgi:hypothetical protein